MGADVGVGAGVVTTVVVAGMVEVVGEVVVVLGPGFGRSPGFGVVMTGRGVVGSGASVVGVVDDGTEELVGGVTLRRGAGGTIAGLLGSLTSLPMIAVNSQRNGLLGARRTLASVRPSSFFVAADASNSISFSMGAFSPRASLVQTIL